MSALTNTVSAGSSFPKCHWFRLIRGGKWQVWPNSTDTVDSLLQSRDRGQTLRSKTSDIPPLHDAAHHPPSLDKPGQYVIDTHANTAEDFPQGLIYNISLMITGPTRSQRRRGSERQSHSTKLSWQPAHSLIRHLLGPFGIYSRLK